MIAGLGVISDRVFIVALAPVSVRHNSRLFSLLPRLAFPTFPPFLSRMKVCLFFARPLTPPNSAPSFLLSRLFLPVSMNTHQLSLSFNLIRHPSPRLPRYITYPGQDCWVGRNQRPRIH